MPIWVLKLALRKLNTAMNELQTFCVDDVEQKMLSLPQADCELFHKFQPGYYIREVHLPKGAIVIGHHQNCDHLNVFISGKVLMLNLDGSTQVLEAPLTFVGQPGRKIGAILEDVVWQNVYPTNQTDVDLLEAQFLTKSAFSLEHAAHKFALECELKTEDRDDYCAAIKELGYTDEQVRIEVNNLEDQIDMPQADYKFVKSISPIHGDGIFATANIAAGSEIGPSRIGFYRTPLGRYVNHSKNPNSKMVQKGDNFFLVSIENIVGAQGGQPGQEITVDYRDSRRLTLGE